MRRRRGPRRCFGYPHQPCHRARTRRALGALNRADGAAVTFADADLRFGKWNESTGLLDTAASAADTDAIEVTARRTVPLVFGVMFGRDSVDIAARATATITAPPLPGIIGLDSIEMTNTTGTDSYDSNLGAFVRSLALLSGHIKSNGNITLRDSVTVKGDARPGPAKSLTKGLLCVVTGSTTTLAGAMNYLPASVGVYGTSNDNSVIASRFKTGDGSFLMGAADIYRMPGGTYCFKNFTVSDGALLTLEGPVKVYISGNLVVAGTAQTVLNRPKNLSLYLFSSGAAGSPGSALLDDAGLLYATIYAPQSPVVITGGSELCGSVVGKSLTVNQLGQIHYDRSLESSKGEISLVQ